jgi:hypothetical protein
MPFVTKNKNFFYFFLSLNFFISHLSHAFPPYRNQASKMNRSQKIVLSEKELAELLRIAEKNTLPEQLNEDEEDIAQSIQKIINPYSKKNRQFYGRVSRHFSSLQEDYIERVLENYREMMLNLFDVRTNYNMQLYAQSMMQSMSYNIYYVLYNLNLFYLQGTPNTYPFYSFPYTEQYYLYYYLLQQAMPIFGIDMNLYYVPNTLYYLPHHFLW